MRWSRQRKLHPQPSAYYAGALLLSYDGESAKRDSNPPWWLTALDPVLANFTGHRANQLHYSPVGSPGKSFALIVFRAYRTSVLGFRGRDPWPIRLRGLEDPARFELATTKLRAWHSTWLSYGSRCALRESNPRQQIGDLPSCH